MIQKPVIFSVDNEKSIPKREFSRGEIVFIKDSRKLVVYDGNTFIEAVTGAETEIKKNKKNKRNR
jgi:hypothetical protein